MGSRSYGQINTLQQFVAELALADLVLEGDERVLDVGCGDGKVTAMIAARLTRAPSWVWTPHRR